MKKIFLSAAALALFFGATLLTSCSKEDTTAPVITLNGEATDVVIFRSAAEYEDLGATADDAEDGAVTVEVTGAVDMNAAGEYTLTYTATDEAGNIAEEIRTVIVDANPFLEGNYTVSGNYDGAPDTYYTTETVTPASAIYNKVYFAGLCAFQDANVYATIEGTTLTFPAQTVMCGEEDPQTVELERHNRIFKGTGTINSSTVTISGTVANASDPTVEINWDYTFTIQ